MDPMDIVCLRAASMEWNVPEKYGPHGEFLFFLIQKKPEIAQNNETLGSFIGDGLGSERACRLPDEPPCYRRKKRIERQALVS